MNFRLIPIEREDIVNYKKDMQEAFQLYINRLGFHVVEFFNPNHKDPNIPDDMIGGDYFFRFEKVMK